LHDFFGKFGHLVITSNHEFKARLILHNQHKTKQIKKNQTKHTGEKKIQKQDRKQITFRKWTKKFKKTNHDIHTTLTKKKVPKHIKQHIKNTPKYFYFYFCNAKWELNLTKMQKNTPKNTLKQQQQQQQQQLNRSFCFC